MNTMGNPLVVLLVLLASRLGVQSSSHETKGPLTDDNYLFHEQLDDNFDLKWKFNSTHIQFHVKVKTDGYVGLGISSHGDMFPGDMVIAWMDDGAVHFHDRHATSQAMPVLDLQQDWHLVKFQRVDGMYNSMTVVRQLNTCDEEDDIPIEKGTTRVIFAYNDQIPTSSDAIPYHGANTRGTKSILLLDPIPSNDDGSKQEEGVIHYDLLMVNYSVPSSDTTYACVNLKMGDLQEKHHMIGFEPVIQKGHEKLVHHIVLYACLVPIPDNRTNVYYTCYEDKNEGISEGCEPIWLAWGIGGKGFNYPPHAGHSLGTSQDPTHFKMEMHYDNVQMRSDFVDSSGIRLLLTKKLRRYDAGMLTVGVSVSAHQAIPPYAPEFLSTGLCQPACFQNASFNGELHVFANLLHSHLIGKRLATRHIRNGNELPPITKDDHYDFDYQEARLLEKERIIKKDDIVMTDCVYDSTGRKTFTYGGLSSREEMCLSFILYYPRTDLTGCYSRLTYSKSGQGLYPDVISHVRNTDWSVKEHRDEFAQKIKISDSLDFCEYGNRYEHHLTSRPLTFEEYQPEDTCQLGGGPLSSSPSHVTMVFLSLLCVLWLTLSRQ